ncbi:MAG: 3,4-dihydroxy-2-butanone-4-phosphate synthase [Bdellovibrionales bacterium]|nr:3,4-dihydroxy-2-butanone-4-phosphate synthase [Bdellovibrionales bacterium]
MTFNTVSELIEDLKSRQMIIIVDDENRENEGDLVLPADFVNAQAINFMSLNARGLICVALTHKQVERLGLSLMVDHERNLSPNKTAFTVSVEAAFGISTGISAADRAQTIKVVADPSSSKKDIITPGHIFPIRSHKGGVLKRAGHTEASVDFCRLAGLNPAAVICEIINPDGSMARVPDLKKFSEQHKIKIGTIEDLIHHRITHESFVEEKVSAPFQSDLCEGVTLKVFQDKINNLEHLVFLKGNIKDGKPVLTRVHSSCITGDLFGGQVTKSGKYLKLAMEKINQEGRGVLIYLCLESMSNRLVNRVKSYLDYKQTSSSGEKSSPFLPLMADEKDYGVGAQILRALGVTKLRLLTNSKKKRVGLKGYGLEIVETAPLD